jgi:hypothetical protein
MFLLSKRVSYISINFVNNLFAYTKEERNFLKVGQIANIVFVKPM